MFINVLDLANSFSPNTLLFDHTVVPVIDALNHVTLSHQLQA